jgi:hypothetical protein
MPQSAFESLKAPPASTRAGANFAEAPAVMGNKEWERDPTRDGGIIGRQWPTLSRAMSHYEQGVAEKFSQLAYDAVECGLIRHEERTRLAKAAEELAIRPFDAQLLIACSLRQWSLDRRYDPTPTTRAPKLSFEYRSWKRVCMRIGLVVCTAAALDWIILSRWLS